MTTWTAPARVLVTGAGGNLGRKAVAALLEAPWCREVLALDLVPPEAADPRVRPLRADLADPGDAAWREAVGGSDAILHLAARHPLPDATWEQAAASFDMTANLLQAALAAGPRRFVHASSNHVMGGHKDGPLGTVPGAIGPETPPAPGTKWRSGRGPMDATPYAAAKLMGERACAAAAAASGGRLGAVSVRIGWCQPGENRPDTLGSAGMPGIAGATGAEAARDDLWFRRMWLSNRDFAALVRQALSAPPDGWPSGAIVVNGMSANRGMPWDLGPGRRLLGYEPCDDVEAIPASVSSGRSSPSVR